MSEEDKKVEKIEPGTGHTKQSFLVGENVYLRPVEEGDAEYAVSWRQDHLPRSVSATESWMSDDLKDEESMHLVIVRKSDDRPVGSIVREGWAHNFWADWKIDPLFGEQGQLWVVEALGMLIPWHIDEQHRVLLHVTVPGDMTIVRNALLELGGRVSTSFADVVKRRNTYYPLEFISFINPHWINLLGDPFDVEKPRSGTGEARPVVAPVQVAPEDVPANAIRIGPRVYLRALTSHDAKSAAQWQRKETEPFWSGGRYMGTETSIEKWYEKLSKDDMPPEVTFAVCLRETNEYIGMVGVEGINWTARCGESLSEFHHLDYRGNGYGSEAKHLMFDYMFNTLGLHSLQSWVMYDNTRSAAALRKQGYRDVGVMPWLVRRDGDFENFGTYELMAADWRAMPRAEHVADG